MKIISRKRLKIFVAIDHLNPVISLSTDPERQGEIEQRNAMHHDI